MRKIWGVWCKGVCCSMMDELKQIKYFKIKIFDCCIKRYGAGTRERERDL